MMHSKIKFPEYSGLRCLMMPYIQGDLSSVPEKYHEYSDIIESLFFEKGDIGYLTIDESVAEQGKPHRGKRAKTDRALHTEAGRKKNAHGWGAPAWGSSHTVTLDIDVQVMLANNIDNSCALWPDAWHENTSIDGDIGYASKDYPYEDAVMMKAGEVHTIGILTPHESLPVKKTENRQFLRIVSSGVHGRESYFTKNPLLEI